MGKVNVYLPADLERAVRAAGLSISAICQAALQRELARLQRLRSTGQAAFTPRLAAIIEALKSDLAAQGRDVTARDLLCGILKHGDNLGARAVAAMGVDLPSHHRAESGGGDGSLAHDAIDALCEAYKVSLDMRHDWLGTEHVVIALAADGSPFREMFAALGISDRLLRQQVERMIANAWTTDHVKPVEDPTQLERLNQEVQRLAAELGRLQEGER
jgi:ATP-dependent Clp protease ATP-binding subunit ClpC